MFDTSSSTITRVSSNALRAQGVSVDQAGGFAEG